jgi:hypothetical protein
MSGTHATAPVRPLFPHGPIGDESKCGVGCLSAAKRPPGEGQFFPILPGKIPECAPFATVQLFHISAALPPERTQIAAANVSDIGAPTEGRMLGKIFAVTFVIGLLVTGSAAFVANHPHALAACASGCD